MKKMYKVLATASILAMAAMPMAASAQDVPVPTSQNGQGFNVTQAKVVPGTMGQITDFVNDKSGKFITVTGRGLATTDQSEMILSITKDTKIVDSKGNPVALKTIIDEKKVVKAFYGSNITKSMPAQGTALTLVVQDHSFTAIDGTVTEVKDDGILVKGKDIYSGNEDTILLHFADKAQLLDQEGKAIQASDIQKGMSVKAFYGPAVAMSLPPQATTNYVVVNTAVQEQAPGTTGIITNVNEDRITVIGHAMEQGGVNYVLLTVDEKTQIVDEEGNVLTKDALKADVRVDAFYGPIMTMSYPGQTHADKIVVKAAEAVKVEGTIEASERAGEGQVYLNVGSDDNKNNDVILNITKDTTIIPGLAENEELKAGMKVVAYHSPIMTKSLPGITNAEIVIVAADNATK
ncbi:peptidase [Paenibacillus selenitireducens]|uniref:Peptidase n=1 Tax=Paenibacillus selenitireducens TaxID=1324314 RepID=A0A1T2X7A2_9BACL|nr:peptidase [Paenibacillus selenitireducens]OPA75757.1 peptidase [Paenibacillus selenitireducens]